MVLSHGKMNEVFQKGLRKHLKKHEAKLKLELRHEMHKEALGDRDVRGECEAQLCNWMNRVQALKTRMEQEQR